jgi:hypothetical protein
MSEPHQQIPGYTYGTSAVSRCPISLHEFDELKLTTGFTTEDHHQLQLAGEVLASQATQIVDHWRSRIIASIPHLARHSQTSGGQPIPEYLSASNLRFEQWIRDTCMRPYNQDWLDYQFEIALRHTSVKKNSTDAVESTPFVPLRDAIAFVAVMNQTIKPYLSANGHSAEQVDRMHLAWCKSIQLQLAIWARAYMAIARNNDEW